MTEESSKKSGGVELLVSRDKPEMTVTRTRKISLAVMPVTPFGKYNLIGKLGHGGMAEVFLAYVAGPAGFRKLCVIKRLHQQLEEEPGFLDMFLDEARLAARLNHPNIVQSFEVGDVDGSHFIAMEYLEGQGLDRIRRHCIQGGLKIPGRIVARMLIDALDGLHYAHKLKDFDGSPLEIVHRDISPQNVFVTYDGVVKLLDFGIAKATTHVVETRTGIVKGKFAYMAPEQARGGELDHRADLWSMGVVLWETLSSRRLFKGPNDLATLNQALLGEIPNIRQVVADVSDPLVRITHKALSREVRDRYQTAHEMKVDLEQSISAEPGGLASRGEVSEFMQSLFAEVIEQHRKVLQICLSDTPQPTSASSNRYRSPELTPPDLRMTPNAYDGPVPPPASESSSGRFTAPMGPDSDSSSQIALSPSSSGSGISPVSATNTPISSQSSILPLAPPARRSEWFGKIAILAAAVVLAVISTVIVLWLYGPRPQETIMVYREPPGGEATTPATSPPVAQAAPPASAVEERPTSDASATPDIASNEQGGDETPTSDETDPSAETQEEPAPPPPSPPLNRPTRPTRPRGPAKARPVRAPTLPPPAPTKESVTEPQGDTPHEAAIGSQPAAEEEYGYLTIDTMPWSRVSVGGRSLGITPVLRAKLPPGPHVISLSNPEQGISTTYRVTIQPGKTTTKRLGLR